MIDEPLFDRLRELGFERLTLWHLRVVEARLRSPDPDRENYRLLSDLRGEDDVLADAAREHDTRSRPLGTALTGGNRDDLIMVRMGTTQGTIATVVHFSFGVGRGSLCGASGRVIINPPDLTNVTCPGCRARHPYVAD